MSEKIMDLKDLSPAISPLDTEEGKEEEEEEEEEESGERERSRKRNATGRRCVASAHHAFRFFCFE